MANSRPSGVAAGLVRSAVLPGPVASALADDPAWVDALLANPALPAPVFDRVASWPGTADRRARVLWHPLAAGRVAGLLAKETRRAPWMAALTAHHDETVPVAVAADVFSGPCGDDLADLVVARFPTSPLIPAAAAVARPSTLLDHLERVAPSLSDAALLDVVCRIGRWASPNPIAVDAGLSWVFVTRPALVVPVVLSGPESLLAAVAVAGVGPDPDLIEVILDRARPGGQLAQFPSTVVHAALATSPFTPPDFAAVAAARVKANRQGVFSRLPANLAGLACGVPAAALTPAALAHLTDEVLPYAVDPEGNDAGAWAGLLASWVMVQLFVHGRPDAATAERWRALLTRRHGRWLGAERSSRLRAMLDGCPAPPAPMRRPRRALVAELRLGPTPAQWAGLRFPAADPSLSAGVLAAAPTRPAGGTGFSVEAAKVDAARAAAAAVVDRFGADVDRWRVLLAVLDGLGPVTVDDAVGVAEALT